MDKQPQVNRHAALVEGLASAAAVGVLVVLIVVIGGAVISSWSHLAAAFTAIEPPIAKGERSLSADATATAIEVGLVAFSLAGVLLAFLSTKPRPWYKRVEFWSIAAFVVISFVANVYAGILAATTGKPDAWRTIAPVRAFAIVVFAGTLPGLILLSLHVAIEVIERWRTWFAERVNVRDREREAERERLLAEEQREAERQRERERRAQAAANRSNVRTIPARLANAPTLSLAPERSPAPGLAPALNVRASDLANDERSADGSALAGDGSSPTATPGFANAASPSERIRAFVEAHGPSHWTFVAAQLEMGKTALYAAIPGAGLSITRGVIQPPAASSSG